MSEIKVMDKNLSNKIAAGEVIEKCASVVKELVENSIDAGSKEIKIELQKSGTKSIRVVDNGCGMDTEDAKKCFLRHATSKIKSEEDLEFINTLGFRGEALSSIASVSDIEINTFKDKGIYMELKGGEIINESVGDERKGTTIEVKDLFYNTPARLKFLKSLNTELANIVNLVEKLSLSNIDISFSLYNDDKLILKTTGNNDLLKTIFEVYGSNISKNMVHINGSNDDYEISGYVSNINVYKSNRKDMITFVNGRIIKNVFINRIIKDAYHTFLADNKYPITIINIEVDATLIDVNIHPTKQDINITKKDNLEDLLFNLIRNTLNTTDNKIVIESKNEILEEKANTNYEEISFDFKVEENKDSEDIIYPVGLVMGTYLICQKDEEMYLIDIHAANERINYEIYLEALKLEKINTTSMLIPVVIEYTKEESIKFNSVIDKIRELGFEIEEFGINTYKVSAHPTWLLEGYEEESIKKIFEIYINFEDKFDRVKFNERLAINLACKMSVKANTNISVSEQEILVKRLLSCSFPYTCPHGRPTIIKYSKYELEKMFKRVN